MLFDRFMGKFHKFWLQNIINFTYCPFSKTFWDKGLAKSAIICHNRVKLSL